VQPYSPQLPWIHFGAHPHGGFIVRDARTGETAHARDLAGVTRFAADHSAAIGYAGAGDAVKAVTSRLGIGSCTPCEARRAQLNGMFPRFWRR
jgi:hypothetical protein